MSHIRERKGQEEMAGFALIVVLVAVVSVIVLGLLVHHEAAVPVFGSTEVHQFLESAMQATGDCAVGAANSYPSIGELVLSCYNSPQETCGSTNETACSALNRSIMGTIGGGWNIGPNYPFKGYLMNIEYSAQSNDSRKPFLTFSSGKCSGSYSADEYLLRESKSRGTIIVGLKVCQ